MKPTTPIADPSPTPPTRVHHVAATLTDGAHPYTRGAWTPNHDEYDATDMEVVGEIPTDLAGVYLRNTENPVHDAIGKYHPFDGDGMLHMMQFADGRATYRNRFVRTRGFEAEAEAGRALWAGIAGKPSRSERPGWGAHERVKDSSSTDVCVHAGKALSTFWQCGEGYRLDPVTLETLGIEGWTPIDGISAHPKVDPHTGELLFFNYSKHAPYMHYGVVGADNRLEHYVPVPLPGPRLPHDMAWTPNHSILCNFPMFWNEDLLERDIHLPMWHPGMPARFAVIPRRGGPQDIRWFEADPTYVLHFNNAYEDGDEIVLDGYFQGVPVPPPAEHLPDEYQLLLSYLDLHALDIHLRRWRFNLIDGTTREEVLFDGEPVEFGTINQQYAGRPYRYAYSALPTKGWFLFDGLMKHDLHTGRTERYLFGPECYGSEAPFAPRIDSKDEDDGYLISFVTDMANDRSECVVLDAKHIAAGPVCRIRLPHRICSGTHATWASAEQLAL